MECIQSDDGQGGTCEDRSWDDDDWGGGDDDDDATSGSCASDEIEDCDGHCGPLSWLGDGECDLGQYAYGGNLIDFNCAALSWDAGDCSGGNSGDDDDTVGDDDDTVGDDDDTVGDDDDSQSGPPETFSDVELSCYPYGTLQATLAFWAWSTGNTGVVRASIQTPSGSEACEFLVSYQGGGVSNKCFGPHAPSYCSTSGPSLPVNDSFYCTGADLWTDWTCSTPLVATFSLLDPTNWSVVWDSVQVSRP